MTAININIEEFINVLVNLRNGGAKLVDLDMLPDENHPSMNRLVLHPVKSANDTLPRFDGSNSNPNRSKISIRNPNISTDNNDIFNALNDLI